MDNASCARNGLLSKVFENSVFRLVDIAEHNRAGRWDCRQEAERSWNLEVGPVSQSLFATPMPSIAALVGDVEAVFRSRRIARGARRVGSLRN